MLFEVDVLCRIFLPLLIIYMLSVADQLPRLRKRELICLLSFTCNYVVSVRKVFLFFLVLGMGCVILSWHSLGIPFNYNACQQSDEMIKRLEH